LEKEQQIYLFVEVRHVGVLQDYALIVLDFTLGTHPISMKGTTEIDGAEATKRF
jgi:hypothetical protein